MAGHSKEGYEGFFNCLMHHQLFNTLSPGQDLIMYNSNGLSNKPIVSNSITESGTAMANSWSIAELDSNAHAITSLQGMLGTGDCVIQHYLQLNGGQNAVIRQPYWPGTASASFTHNLSTGKNTTTVHKHFDLPLIEKHLEHATDSCSTGLAPRKSCPIGGVYAGAEEGESFLHENTEDLDALLRSDDDGEDDDVKSTGHSPDEFLLDENCSNRHDKEQPQCNKRKGLADDGDDDDEGWKTEECLDCDGLLLMRRSHRRQCSRRQKIKDTVNALRRIIPGGAFLDGALVLDETILYVKALRDRVHELETNNIQTIPLLPCGLCGLY